MTWPTALEGATVRDEPIIPHLNHSRRQRDCAATLYPSWVESFDDGHARIPQPLSKRRAHRIIRAADDEVHDLDGREDDAQALTHAREGLREEAIVERAHDLLLARQGVHCLDSIDHRPIEGIQLAALVLEHRVRRQHLHNRVHRAAHRVLLRERMIRKHRVKERERQDVLGQHLHRRLVVDGRVQRRAQQIFD